MSECLATDSGKRRAREGNEAVHGEYKAPADKLLVVDLDAEEGVLRNVRVTGAFFLEPDDIFSINTAPEGSPSSTDVAGLAVRITAALLESTVMLGLTAEGTGIAVRRALAHATEWGDYDWQLVHTEPQEPARPTFAGPAHLNGLPGHKTDPSQRCSPEQSSPG